MSHELWYTSAARGLFPGSNGFCTVKATRGIPVVLRTTLESISAYRHVFPPNHRSASLNPVAFSYVRLEASGREWRVLSRTCAAGLDHTQRSNSFSHHVALENDDVPLGGPAWLLEQAGFMEVAWDHTSQNIEAGRNPPLGSAAMRACRNWQKVVGDTGWAGFVAGALADGLAPVYLIFEPGMPLLPLVAEALSLLPESRRWDFPFSTYFTSLPQGIKCVLRCVAKGAPEAQQAGKLPGAKIVDLTQPLGRPNESVWTAVARSGRPAALAHSQPPRGTVREPARARVEHPPALGRSPDEQELQPGGEPAPDPFADFPPPPPSSAFFQRLSFPWPAAMGIGAGIGVLLVLLVGVPFVVFENGRHVTEVAALRTEKAELEQTVGKHERTIHETDQRLAEAKSLAALYRKWQGRQALLRRMPVVDEYWPLPDPAMTMTAEQPFAKPAAAAEKVKLALRGQLPGFVLKHEKGGVDVCANLNGKETALATFSPDTGAVHFEWKARGEDTLPKMKALIAILAGCVLEVRQSDGAPIQRFALRGAPHTEFTPLNLSLSSSTAIDLQLWDNMEAAVAPPFQEFRLREVRFDRAMDGDDDITLIAESAVYKLSALPSPSLTSEIDLLKTLPTAMLRALNHPIRVTAGHVSAVVDGEIVVDLAVLDPNLAPPAVPRHGEGQTHD